MMEKGERVSAEQGHSVGYGAVLFDAGDTLILRQPREWQHLQRELLRGGIEVSPAVAQRAWKQAKAWVGEQGLRELAGEPPLAEAVFVREMCGVAIRAALGETGPGDWQQALTERMAEVWAAVRREGLWQAEPTAARVLSEVGRRGYRLGLVSNFEDTLPGILAELGLAAHFEQMIVSDLVGVAKPDPRILRMACERLGVHPSEALYVGDHPFDVLCAAEAGVDVAWLAAAEERLPAAVPYEPQYRLGELVELLELL
jgi:HAD superfamily hydrolase (TIGR01549 family)